MSAPRSDGTRAPLGGLAFLWRQAPLGMSAALAGAALTAALMMLLLNLIGRRITAPSEPPAVAWPLFAVICVAAVAAQVGSSLVMSDVGARVVRRLRGAAAAALLHAPLAAVEARGAAALRVALVEDALRVSAAMPGAVVLLRDGVFAVGGLGYLAWLSPPMFAALVAVIVIGACLVVPLQRSAMARQEAVRSSGEHLGGLFDGLLEGLPQLKLSRRLRDGVVGALQLGELRLARASTGANAYLTVANAGAVSLFLSCVAALLYVEADRVRADHLSVYLLVLLLLLSPLQNIVATLQTLGQASLALERLDGFSDVLGEEASRAHAPERAEARVGPKLEFVGLVHDYGSDEQHPFRLGPVDAAVGPGEALFVVGGNGSGKTTFVKIACGLYAAAPGMMKVDGAPLRPTELTQYRDRVLAVFADNCLFEGLAETPWDVAAADAPIELEQLRLERLIDCGGGLHGVAAACSTGERKRLALLLALREAKDVAVFDEFAADQDPEARAFFYETLLPALKAEGRTVIVVTHDDRYFGCADHILKLERGGAATFQSARTAKLVATERALA